MNRRSLFLFFVCLFATFFAGGNGLAAASDMEMKAEPLAGEIRSLSASIQNLTRLLEEQSRAGEKESTLRKLDIAISYLNFRSRRIEAVERDLNGARKTKERFEDLIREWSQREEALEDEIRDNPQGGSKELEQAKKEAGLRKKMLEQRMMRLDGDIVVLENRISELQNQIDSVESFVQRNLEL